VKVAVCIDAAEPSSGAHALAVGKALAGADGLWAITCAGAAPPQGEALARAAGPARVVVVADAALDGSGVRARGHVLAALAGRVGADLVLAPAGGEDGGLLAAALAVERGATLVLAADGVAADPGRRDAVVITTRLGGRRRRLRVTLPAVVSLAPGPEAPEPAPTSAARAAPEILRLAELGLDPAALPADPGQPPGLTRVRRKPVVVTGTTLPLFWLR
jgi:electron transfer flavoprotein alpha/beta subunit